MTMPCWRLACCCSGPRCLCMLHVVLVTEWAACFCSPCLPVESLATSRAAAARTDHDDDMLNFKRRRFLSALPVRVVKRFQG